MEREDKTKIIEEMRTDLAKSAVVLCVDFRGLKVGEVTGLRRELRKEGVTYRVVKNTLARNAMDDTMRKALEKHVRGPTALAYSFDDPVAPARVLAKAAKSLPKLTIKAGYLSGRPLTPPEVEQLAAMPGRNELRAMFLGLLVAPAAKFVRVLAAGPAAFVRLLDARKRSLEGAANSSSDTVS